MALDLDSFKANLKTALVGVNNANNKDNVAPDDALKNLADALGAEIDRYIRTAEVTVTALPSEVSVTSATAGPSANATALTFKGGDTTHTGGLS